MPVFRLTKELVFPHPRYAEEDGLIAVGGDLSVKRLLLAYANGIFPWYSEGYPILWWSTDPRMVIFPNKLKVSKSMRTILNRGLFEIKFDTSFEEVIHYCAKSKRNGQTGTWITNDMIDAYIKLHQAGFCHSVETYFGEKLVGGLYGVSLGKAFFGESMFHLMSNASKASFIALVEKLKEYGFSIIDAQQDTGHLRSLGAEAIPRDEFLDKIKEALNQPSITGSWKHI